MRSCSAKGTKTHVTAHAARKAKRWANGGQDPRIPAHRYLDTGRQAVVESRNNVINENMMAFAKPMCVYMEQQVHVYLRSNPHHKGALQVLLCLVLEVPIRNILHLWDIHMVRSASRNRGVPWKLRRDHPHLGPLTPIPVGIDFVADYEAANGVRLRREPSWAAARDPLYGQPARQAQRMAAVMAIWGTKEAAWADVMHNSGRGLFIPSYLQYLRFT